MVRNAFPATLSMAAQAPWMRLSLIVTDAEGDLPCQGQEHARWISENPDQRALAVAACHACPALHACGEYATAAREVWGVWGGVDRCHRDLTADPDLAVRVSR